MNEMTIRRKYLSEIVEVVDLHVLADASLGAMCIVIHFQHEQAGEFAYVEGKCKVVPMKQQTLPRVSSYKQL